MQACVDSEKGESLGRADVHVDCKKRKSGNWLVCMPAVCRSSVLLQTKFPSYKHGGNGFYTVVWFIFSVGFIESL